MNEGVTKIIVEKTAKVTLNTECDVPKEHLLVALHGYGQLSFYFGRKFNALLPFVDIAIPEGLHRFYTEGSAGRVGASWMTKEERQDDIGDNLKYLKKVVDHFQPQYSKMTILGFSQGGATAARFFMEDNRVNQLILCASILPPDLPPSDFTNDERPRYFILGTNDPFFDEQSQKDVLDLYQSIGFNVHSFIGEHDINTDVLVQILRK